MNTLDTQTRETDDLRRQLQACEARQKLRDRVFGAMIRAFVLSEAVVDERGHAYDYRVLEVNRAFTTLTGIPASAAVGQTLRTLCAEISPQAIDMLGSIAGAERGSPFDVFSTTLGRWLEILAFSPEPGKIGCFVLDISARKTIEQALRESEDRLRLATQAADVGVFDWDIEHDRAIWQNERMYSLFARDPQRGPISKAEFVRDYLVPEDLPTFEAALAAGATTGGRVNIVHRIRRPDGEIRSFELFGRFVDGETGTRLLAVVADVTDRERGQELKRREREFRTLAEHSPDLIARVDRNLRYLYVNPAVENITGIRRKAYVGRTSAELLMSSESVAFWEACLREVFAKGEKKSVEFTFSDLGGAAHTYEWLMLPEVGPDGRVETVLSSARDVTERKAAERATRDSVVALQNVLDNVPAMITWYNTDGSLRFVNKALEERVGWRLEELRAGDFLAMLVRDPQERVAAREHMNEPGRNWHDFHLTARDGVEFDTTWSNVRLNDGSQVGIGIDITERKRREQQARLAGAVFRSTNEGIFVTDLDHAIVAVNPAFTDITGFPFADVRGHTPETLYSGTDTEGSYGRIWQAVVRDGQWQGEIWNRRRDGEVYPAWQSISAVKDEQGGITNYVAVLSDISPIKRAEARLDYLAHHDALTGLPNRFAFAANLEQSLERAKRHNERVALLFLDLDRFKMINDTLGHAAGDRLLQMVAERLKTCVRAEDLVTRLGGDEFTIVIEELRDPREAGQLAEKVIQALARPISIDGREVVTSVSVGIGVFPDNAADAEGLAKVADTAMYRAKERGRSRYAFYSPDLTLRAIEYFMIESQLRQALARKEFVLHYQPRIDLATGELRGAEALLRWRHPERGLLPPADFIRVAEESGLIEPIGEWVVREALAQVNLWRCAGIGSIPIAVNMCGREVLHDHHVIEAVESARRECTLSQTDVQLDIEVTESVMQSMNKSSEVLRELRAGGVGIAIDDFGTGYSSLSRLMDLPIDTLKIDRSFVRGIPHEANRKALTAAIISMGHSLGMRVIAEGVETREQLAFLAQQRCDEAQGFLISRAVPPDEIGAMLRHGRRLISVR